METLFHYVKIVWLMTIVLILLDYTRGWKLPLWALLSIIWMPATVAGLAFLLALAFVIVNNVKKKRKLRAVNDL